MSFAPFRSRTSAVPAWFAEGRFPLLEAYAPPLGRLLMSVIFIVSGITKIMNFSGMVAYSEAHHLPAPQVMLVLALIVELVGGLMILFGFQARIAALVLFLFLIPTTLLFHNFWAYEGAMREMQLINFMKNLAIMGGLLILSAFGPGALSVDRTRSRGIL